MGGVPTEASMSGTNIALRPLRRAAHKPGPSSVSMMTVSDSDLFSRWRAGAPGALEAVIRKHVAAVRAVALAIAGDADEADDVCQDTFVRSWERRTQCRGPEQFEGWLMSIARNEALSRHRRQQSRSRARASAVPGAPPEGSDRILERSELRNLLTAGLRTLPEVKGVVLILRDLEGWSHREVADHLGISEAMSRRHLSDARKLMRAYLTRRGVEHEQTG